MDKSKKFLEFVKNNPPPCLPGDRLYWFCPETGKILQDKYGISNIVLDDNWNWLIQDENELIVPNEDAYFCVTPEDAKKFRDAITDFKYAVLAPFDTGEMKVKVDKEEKVTAFTLLKVRTLDVKTIHIDESYFDAILRTDSDVKPGMVLKYYESGKAIREFYMVMENNTIEQVFLTGTNKKTIRKLEDLFD